MIGTAKLERRHTNGNLLQGYSHEGSSTDQCFHVRRDLVGCSDPGQQASLRDLKAVFFVRDFAGYKAYNEYKVFATGKPLSGRELEVTFADGELLVGTTSGYDAQLPGFFLFPAFDKSNNARMFIIASAVKEVRFL